jgi:hypothetical protein
MNATTEKRDHEGRDVDVPLLLTIAFLLFFSCVIIFLIVWGMMHYFKLHEPAKAGQANLPVTSSREFPKPRLQVIGAVDLAKLRIAEEADLNSYGWIDRNSGVVRIPIERAVQLLLQRGLPDVGAGQTPLSLMQARPAESATPPQLLKSP